MDYFKWQRTEYLKILFLEIITSKSKQKNNKKGGKPQLRFSPLHEI